MEYNKNDKEFLNGIYNKIIKLKVKTIEKEQILESSKKLKKIKIYYAIFNVLIFGISILFIKQNKNLIYILNFFLLSGSVYYENLEYRYKS